MHLIFGAEDRGTLQSVAWEGGGHAYNPDLCFISTDNNNQPVATTRKVLLEFPHSQNHPVLIEIGVSIPVIRSFSRSRWNFQKIDWEAFSKNHREQQRKRSLEATEKSTSSDVAQLVQRIPGKW